jgi:hypothetical protein
LPFHIVQISIASPLFQSSSSGRFQPNFSKEPKMQR